MLVENLVLKRPSKSLLALHHLPPSPALPHSIMSKLSSQLLHHSSVKLNAAGLTPECSLVLPERAAKEDEVAIMHAIEEVSRTG